MKKTIIVATLATLSLAGMAPASSIEYDRRGNSEQIQVCLERPIKGSVGVFAYSCQTKNWGETYVGPELNGRFSNVNYQVAYGAGLETGGFRHGGWLWAGRGKFSAIYLHEDGATGAWYKTTVKYQVADKIALGLTKSRYVGQGIYAELKLGRGIILKYSGYNTPELGLKVSF